jgi:hypothetical protein
MPGAREIGTDISLLVVVNSNKNLALHRMRVHVDDIF